MRRLPSSLNDHNISDQEIDEIFYGTVQPNVLIPLVSRNYGDRVLIVGVSSKRVPLIEIGIEDRNDELVIFHAREATQKSIKTCEEQTRNRRYH